MTWKVKDDQEVIKANDKINHSAKIQTWKKVQLKCACCLMIKARDGMSKNIMGASKKLSYKCAKCYLMSHVNTQTK